MSGSTEIAEDFCTPDRSATLASRKSPDSPSEEKKDSSGNESGIGNSVNHNTVTPPESVCRDDKPKVKDNTPHSPVQLPVSDNIHSPPAVATDPNKQVRFNPKQKSQAIEIKSETPDNSPASTNGNKRGLVSRRGGRAGSPARSVLTSKTSPSNEPVLEFKTFRSPPRKRNNSDNVPSLCSTGSGITSPLLNNIDKTKTEDGETNRQPVKSSKKQVSKTEEEAAPTSSSLKSDENEAKRKPISVSCDSESVERSSPLNSTEAGSTADDPDCHKESGRLDMRGEKKSNVTFSPTPTIRENITDKSLKTPTKSLDGGEFQTLPSLDDAGFKSPVGIFLSPRAPTPRSIRSVPSYEKHDDTATHHPRQNNGDDEVKELEGDRSPEKSPRTKDQERERFVATPTNFAIDYGKGHPSSGSFDTSNVLAWLQSPTANGLFSPGGLGSIMNTPRGGLPTPGGYGPRTPRSPFVSTSFFFSDVASLPRNGDLSSPKPGSDVGKKNGSQRGYSNIICISPLASTKGRNGILPHMKSPIDYNEVFASPTEKSRARGLSLLADSPVKGAKGKSTHGRASKDPSLDAVQAERDLMEDEDLRVLLQFASNTPRSVGERPPAVSTSDGTHVFRSPNGRKDSKEDEENLPSLQFPIIGANDGEGNGTRLSRKTHSRDHHDSEAFNSTLGIRPSSSGLSRDIYPSKSKLGSRSSSSDDKADSDEKRKSSSKSSEPPKKSKKSSLHPNPPPYPMPPHPYPHPGGELSYYPPLPPGMPPGGSMRVTVGGPPPSRSSKGSPHNAGSPPGHHPYPMGHGDGPYPPPPPPPQYPPPPGHYPHHVPPPHMAPHHPYHSHYPPPPPPHPSHRPPHMPPPPMYSSQHPPPGKSKGSTKKSKPSKPTKSSASKRPAQPLPVKSASVPKKQKKSGGGGSGGGGGSPPSAPKKKNKSPQLTDKGERQKAAATIQAVNEASGGKNNKAAALAAAILRGVTMRPSGKWQAQLYFAGKSRYIGVFDTREKAALAYEIAREKLKSEKSSEPGGLSPKQTEAAVNSARKAAFEGVNERDPRLSPTK